MTLSLDALLETYRTSAATEREKGTYYERFCAAFLLNDPVQAEQYDQVLTWSEWATEHGWNGKDVGIDLVARRRDGNGYAAVQCKFYAAKHKIAKADIDSFLSASSKFPFTLRVVMDSTELEWSENAEAMLVGQTIPVLRIGLVDMRASPIQWGLFAAKQEVVLDAKKELRPHQRDALDAVRVGLAEHDRGKIIMACGTGKTFTGLKIAEEQVGADGAVLFLVPSLALMAQTVREWTTDTTTPLRSFAVCSDTQVGKRRVAKDDIAEISTLDLAFPATTNPATLAAGVTDEEAAHLIPSGRLTVLQSRAHWARTYLGKAGLLESPKRNLHVITPRGREVLASPPTQLDLGFLEGFEGFKEWRARTATDVTGEPNATTKVTGDGGIDGIIDEDALGLDAVYIQAKRYDATYKVGRPDLQRFVGSLTGEGASKGVFVTTSDFSREAVNYVDRVQHRIRLINGQKLAGLMIQYGVGVRPRSRYIISSIDEDYFADV